MTRKDKKVRAREARQLRQVLVHSAGCADPRCGAHLALQDEELWNDIISAGVRIPRTIKKGKITKWEPMI